MTHRGAMRRFLLKEKFEIRAYCNTCRKEHECGPKYEFIGNLWTYNFVHIKI